MTKFHKTLLFVVALLLWLSCTDNPFINSPDFASRSKISGKVSFALADTSVSTRAYIWLEELNVGVFTNAFGEYEMSLPSSAATALEATDGYTGVLKLYAYNGNMSPDSQQIVMHQGKVVLSQGGVGEDGVVAEMKMQQLYTIEMTTTPKQIVDNRQDTLSIAVRLSKARDEIFVNTFGANNNDILAVVAVPENSLNPTLIIHDSLAGELKQRVILQNGAEWNGQIVVPENLLISGKYQLIPYIWTRNIAVPNELLEALSVEETVIDKNFAKIPFARTNAELIVQTSKFW